MDDSSRLSSARANAATTVTRLFYGTLRSEVVYPPPPAEKKPQAQAQSRAQAQSQSQAASKKATTKTLNSATFQQVGGCVGVWVSVWM